MEWNESKKLLLKDLKGLIKNRKAKLIWGMKSYTPEEMIIEIDNETEVGKQHIQLRIDTEEKIQEILKNNPPKKKKRWQFWK